MKKYLLLGIIVTLGFSLNVAAQSQSLQFSENDWIEMIDNYDGLFRNHKKTDGIRIGQRQLDVFVDFQNKYKDKKMALYFARYLKSNPPVNGKKKRVTLLLQILVTPKGGGSVNQEEYVYIDLGWEDLCPPPDCSEDQ